MGKFDRGISYYTSAELNTLVFFPEGELACKYCPFLSWNDRLNIGRCKVTDKILYTPEFIPNYCPLEFKED